MSNVFDIIKQYTVIVDGGSGVLVQPMTDKYSYVLTAKHNLMIDYNDDQSGVKELSQIDLMTYGDEKLTAIDIYDHHDLDIAVIKIDFRQGIEVYPYQKSPRAGDSVMLYGYPGIKRSPDSKPTSEKIECYPLIVIAHSKDEVSCRNEDMSPLEEVKGFSGGGFFHVDEDQDKAFLVGIENEMGNTRASYERLKGIPVTEFSNLLKENELSPLKPIYLSGFKYLNKNIFDLNDCVNQVNISHVKNFLNNIFENKTKETIITPCDILSKFKQNLKVYRRSDSELEGEPLWIAVLELLVLTDLLGSSEKWNEAHIDTLFKSFRFIFINSSNGWKRHLQEILSTPTEGLNSDGRILVIVGGDLPVSPLIPEEFITQSLADITRGITDETIANVKLTIGSDISIIHWVKLHNECISDREFEYKALNLVEHQEEIHKMLSGDYSRYLKS